MAVMLLWAVAIFVMCFGFFRIGLGVKKKREENAQRGAPGTKPPPSSGLFGRSSKVDLVYGAVYLVLAGLLIARGMGWDPPFAWSFLGNPK